jgi:hypothetical protein
LIIGTKFISVTTDIAREMKFIAIIKIDAQGENY